MRGEGKGVTSAMALSIGEENAELGAEPKPELLPTLDAIRFLTLGVRASGPFIDLVNNRLFSFSFPVPVRE